MRSVAIFILIIFPSLVHGQKMPLGKFYQTNIAGYIDVIEFKKCNRFERMQRACMEPTYGKGTYRYFVGDSCLVLYYGDYPHQTNKIASVYTHNDSGFNFIEISVILLPCKEGAMYASCVLNHNKLFAYTDSNGAAAIKLDKAVVEDSISIFYVGHPTYRVPIDFKKGNQLKVTLELQEDQSKYLENTSDTIKVARLSKRRIDFKGAYTKNYIKHRSIQVWAKKQCRELRFWMHYITSPSH